METPREKALYDFIEEVNATKLAEVKVNRTSELQIWLANGKNFIVNVFRARDGYFHGFEIYVPAYPGNELKYTLARAKDYINSNVYAAPIDTFEEHERVKTEDEKKF